MLITIRFFATFRDIVGTGSLERQVDAAATISDMIAQLEQEYPQLSGQLEKVGLVAVNETYTHRQYVLQDGDMVAFFPPVSGG